MQRRRKKQIKKHKTKITIWSFSFIFGISFLLFNETGFIQWIKLKNKKQQTSAEIQQLLSQQIKLRDEIKQLESDEEYLEKVARERFMMVKPGEKLFRIVDEKQLNSDQ